MGMQERNNLMQKITRISFLMDDLRLFLDTHPDCTKALCKFNELARERSELVDRYNKLFGPLNSYNDNYCDQSFRWVDAPWPWEGEC